MATTKITSPDLFNLESLNTALKLPSGTTAQRPTSPSTGEWRYNTTTNLVEFWDGGAWRDLQSENIPPVNSENFNTVLYTGTGAAQSITGVGFKPDWIWIKERTSTSNNVTFDSTRGIFEQLYITTDAESNNTSTVSSFDTNGFSVGSGLAVNENGQDYVAWCWKANGGTTSSNTDGTNTSTVQANTKAGFSIVSYTGTGNANMSYGHGLSTTPNLMIIKSLNSGEWCAFGPPIFERMNLNDTAADQNNFGVTATSTTIETTQSASQVGNVAWNGSGVNYISYCFASVAGYSSIGSYTGNGSANGPIINTGFEPAFVMTKKTSGTSSWAMFDNKRNTSNPRINFLRANSSDAEQTDPTNYAINFFSNGFQWNGNGNDGNINGETYIYIAFAADASTAPVLADSFANKLYTGTGSAQSITGLGFSPSFAWIKGRTNTASHQLFDTLRGATYQISSDTTGAQTQNTQMLTSFDTDGFSLGNQSSVNGSGVNYVAWNWKANSVPTINTDGTRQAIVSANAASGFSIMKYTGDGNTATIGHGLSSAPEIIFVKKLTGTSDWPVYASGLTSAAYRLVLSSSDAESTTNDEWNSTAPTSTVISVGSGGNVSDNGATFIAYCFASISGFSKIGTYAGSASAVSVDTGFQASFVLIKRTDTGTTFWNIFDSARGGDKRLYPNSSNAETDETSDYITFDSDGFNVDVTSNSDLNQSGGTFLYMAFKENPTPMPLAGNMSFLVVAGGGGGGFGSGGGGAGAGGLRTSYGGSSGGGSAAESDITLAAGTYTITIGAGGTGGIDTGNVLPTAGANSTVSTITSTGGGYGGSEASGSVYGPSVGGSGAGAIYNNTYPGSAGTANQGSAGGNGYASSPIFGGGGGGGASAAGATASGSGGGLGGDGLEVSITGTPTYYAGGGGGDTQGVNTTRAGGAGGGGTGGRYMAANDITTATGGTANTGGGGGGGTNENDTDSGLGGPGGSGVVILRLATSEYSGTTTGSPTVTTDGTYTILTYTGSGTYVHS